MSARAGTTTPVPPRRQVDALLGGVRKVHRSAGTHPAAVESTTGLGDGSSSSPSNFHSGRTTVTAAVQSPPRVIDLTHQDSPPCPSEAFERLYAEFVPRVRGLVRKLIHDDGVVDDLVQETFLRAYNAGLHFEYERAHPEHTQWPWLAAVGRNLALDVLRRRKGVTENELDEEVEFAEIGGGEDPELHLLASRRRESIAEALHSVSDRHRRVLVMKCVEGKRYDEIAALEGISVDALKSVLARARRTFRTSYAAIAERQGLGILVGGTWIRTLPARIRAWRDRFVAAADGGMTNLMAAGGPAAANAMMTAVVLGSAVVAAGLLGSSAAGAGIGTSAPPANVSFSHAAPSASVSAHGAAAAVAVDVTANDDASIAVTTQSGVANSAPPQDGFAAAPGSEPGGALASVDAGDVVPVEDPPASAGASVGTSQEGPYRDVDMDVGADADGDGQPDAGLANDADTDCSPDAQRKSTTLTAACLAFGTVDGANLPTAGS